MSAHDTICRLRWDYPIVNLGRSESRLCCRTPGHTITNDDIEKHGTDVFLNNAFQLEQRLEMLQGVRNAGCASCWKLEDNKMESPRLGTKDFVHSMKQRGLYPEGVDLVEFGQSVTLDSPILKSYNPDMLEISLGNLCDMKCMYCSHHYSTQWASELIKFKEIIQSDYDKEFPKPDEAFEVLFWKWFNETGKHTVKRIGVIGGEPLINPKFYEFVDKLIEAYSDMPEKKKKVNLWIVTNLNTPRLYFNRFINNIPKLTEYFNLELHASMESTGKQAEYIRYGVDWNLFESNVKELLAGKHDIEYGFQIAINALSVPYMKDLLVWIKGLHDEFNTPIALKQNIVSYPDFQSPLILTPDFTNYLHEAIEWIDTIKDGMLLVNDRWGRWDAYPKFLVGIAHGIATAEPDIEKRKKFHKWFTQYDSRRNTDFVKTFPEMNDFWEHCKSL